MEYGCEVRRSAEGINIRLEEQLSWHYSDTAGHLLLILSKKMYYTRGDIRSARPIKNAHHNH